MVQVGSAAKAGQGAEADSNALDECLKSRAVNYVGITWVGGASGDRGRPWLAALVPAATAVIVRM